MKKASIFDVRKGGVVDAQDPKSVANWALV